MRRAIVLIVVWALVMVACGGGGGESEDTQATPASIGAGNGDGTDGGSSGGGSENAGEGDASTASSSPDNEDFGDITGNPDLDTDDIPGQAGDLADQVDDIVSIGDCVAVGLMAIPPENWSCRVLDNPTPTFDGFTMFTEGNDLNITVGTPSPLGLPCDVLQACDDATPIELSSNFPDTMILEFVGTIMIWGTHASGAQLVITKASALTDDELQLIMDVLDSVGPA